MSAAKEEEDGTDTSNVNAPPATEHGAEQRESTPVVGTGANSFFDTPDQAKMKRARRLAFFNHFSPRDLKELFKCSMAVWIMTVFIVIDPVLRAEGQAIFFGCIALFIIPPSGVVVLQVMIGVMMLVGMALAWAWGVITMKAALAARPQAETNQRLAQLQQEATQNATHVGQLSGQTTYAQVLIFEGFMLDARVTVVYYCMICVFIYLLARLRVKAPKLILVQIFGTIISDIFLTTAPLLPNFSGTIAQTLVKPAATAIGLGIVCNVLLFPESTSHIVLNDIKQLLRPMGEFVDACRMSFDNSAKPMNIARLLQAKTAGISGYKGLETRLAFLPLDVSFSRWSSEDVALLKKPLKSVFVGWSTLVESQITRSETRARFARMLEQDEAREKGGLASDSESSSVFAPHEVAQQLDFARLFRGTESEGLIVKSMAALQGTGDPLLISCRRTIEAVVEIIEMVNERKFYNRPASDAWDATLTKHRDILQELRKQTTAFVENTPSRLLDPHAHFFDNEGNLDPPPNSGFAPLRGVILGLILQERIIVFARGLEHLLAQVVALQEQRRRARLWLPTGLRHLGSLLFGRAPTPRVFPVIPEFKEEQEKPEPRHRRRHAKKDASAGAEETATTDIAEQLMSIHLHRRRQRGAVGQFFLEVIHWFSSTEAMFALRMLVLTIALGVPAVIPSSAGFYYREKGLWALIMGQLSLVPYAADFTWGLLLRLLGSVVGGVLGMLAWYIGAADGPGNPYGIAAIMVPVILVLMYGRLFGHPALIPAFMLTGATCYLTVAYSWIDTHIPSYGNPGLGCQVFWRRLLLVIVGFAAACIVMYFPRPPSAGRHYRRVLSHTLSNFKDLYAFFITDFARMQRDNEEERPTELVNSLEQRMISTADTLSSIAGPIQLLRFEFSSSDFTASGLSRLNSLANTVNFNLFQLFYYSVRMPPDFRARFRALSGLFEEHFVGDFMAVLSLLAHSLETGEALPSVISAPLTVRAFRDRHVQLQQPPFTAADSKFPRIAAYRHLLGPVTRQMIEHEQEGFRVYCIVLSALVGMLNAIDEMVLVTKEELGETHFVDVEAGSGGDNDETRWLMGEKGDP